MQKKRKTIERERLEISLRKLEIPRKHFMQSGLNKGQKWYGSNRSRRYEEEVAIIYRRTIQKHLHDPDNHGVITHLEPDILECEVKWALGIITTNKASGGDRIPVELFQILKDDAVKVLHSIRQQIWKTQQ